MSKSARELAEEAFQRLISVDGPPPCGSRVDWDHPDRLRSVLATEPAAALALQRLAKLMVAEPRREPSIPLVLSGRVGEPILGTLWVHNCSKYCGTISLAITDLVSSEGALLRCVPRLDPHVLTLPAPGALSVDAELVTAADAEAGTYRGWIVSSELPKIALPVVVQLR